MQQFMSRWLNGPADKRISSSLSALSVATQPLSQL